MFAKKEENFSLCFVFLIHSTLCRGQMESEINFYRAFVITHSFIFVFASFLAFQGHDISRASTLVVDVFKVLHVCVLWLAEMKCCRKVTLWKTA